jgi:hypothetical protein
MSLTSKQVDLCRRTMSANAFFELAMDALDTGEDLSAVRAADGEKKLVEHCRANPTGVIGHLPWMTPGWLERYGCKDIPRALLLERIERGVSECTYFAPSISGIRMPAYDVYDTFQPREIYVDNFFPNSWREDQKIELFKKAKRVLVICGNPLFPEKMRSARLGADVRWTRLETWQDAESIIRERQRFPLTLFSAGPASKYIGPSLPGVTLDIGEAMKRWTFESLK